MGNQLARVRAEREWKQSTLMREAARGGRPPGRDARQRREPEAPHRRVGEPGQAGQRPLPGAAVRGLRHDGGGARHRRAARVPAGTAAAEQRPGRADHVLTPRRRPRRAAARADAEHPPARPTPRRQRRSTNRPPRTSSSWTTSSASPCPAPIERPRPTNSARPPRSLVGRPSTWAGRPTPGASTSSRSRRDAKSGQAAALAYAQAQQAYILLDAGELDAAHALVQAGQRHAGTRVSPVLRAWLHAAEGETLAALGQRDAALRALDAAAATLPENAEDDALPYLMLDADHLARWRGHCLARLGDHGAIDDLTSALDAMGEGQYGRAEVSLRVDLALAFNARGDTHRGATARTPRGRAGRTDRLGTSAPAHRAATHRVTPAQPARSAPARAAARPAIPS